MACCGKGKPRPKKTRGSYVKKVRDMVRKIKK